MRAFIGGGILGAVLPLPVLLITGFVERVVLGLHNHAYFIILSALIELLVLYLLWRKSSIAALVYLFVNLPLTICCVKFLLFIMSPFGPPD